MFVNLTKALFRLEEYEKNESILMISEGPCEALECDLKLERAARPPLQEEEHIDWLETQLDREGMQA